MSTKAVFFMQQTEEIRRVRSRARSAALVLVAIAQVGCGGGSDVGDQPVRAPEAVATIVGYAAGGEGSGDAVAEVRAQAEVLLTGKDSINADKPILAFLWEPENAGECPAELTIRNANTVNVTLPATSQPMDCRFRLTIRDSDGDTDSATATLRVQPVLDSNHFLTLRAGLPRIRVVVATTEPIVPGADFTLTGKWRPTYRSRAGADPLVTPETWFDLGPVVTSGWSPQLGSGGDDANDYRNPVVDFPMPSIDMDDINRPYLQASEVAEGKPADTGKLIDPAYVDQATMEVVLSLEAPALQGKAKLVVVDRDGMPIPGLSAVSEGNGLPATLVLSDEQLQDLILASGGLENRDTATSYYKAIDPANDKNTLRKWLVANCFEPDAPTYGADAHAVYTNNFDLGFGRDMYFRTARPDGCASSTFERSDAAAVVINYPTLEAAAKKVGPIIAVAMEYKASDEFRSGPGNVTFYAFTPDEATGEFERVLSANFDGRGEKYIPGSCTACHGGTPAAALAASDPKDPYKADPNSYRTAGNVGATFIPWDLESFLYSETDPAFPEKPRNASLAAGLTRDAQESEFRKLNLAALSTYGQGDPGSAGFSCYANYAAPCELVSLWYGGQGSPDPGFHQKPPEQKFQDRIVPEGWKSDVPGIPPDSEGIYLNVMARNCRACHTQLVNVAKPKFASWNELKSNQEIIRELVFATGSMPGARLTDDRTWVPANGIVAGDLLAAHFGHEELGGVAPQAPGAPVACATGMSDDPSSRTTLERHESVRVFGVCSQFGSVYTWKLKTPELSTALLPVNQLPIASFRPDKAGDYDLTLEVAGPGGGPVSVTRYGNVADATVDAFDFVGSDAVDVDLNQTKVIDVLARSSAGDAPTSVEVIATSTDIQSSVIDDGNKKLVAVTALSAVGGNITYRLTDDDNQSDIGTIQINVPIELSAQPGNLTVTSGASTPTELDLTSLVSSQGQSVTITISQPTLIGLITTNGSILGRAEAPTGQVILKNCNSNSANLCAAYTPPKGASSVIRYADDNGILQDHDVGDSDQFTYTVCLQAQPTYCKTNVPVTVVVTGSQDFKNIANILRDTCAAQCHVEDSIYGEANVHWMLDDPVANVSDKDARCAVLLAGDDAPGYPDDGDDSGKFIVNLDKPDESLLYLKPANGTFHGGGEVMNVDFTQIQQWIKEGAYLTNDTDQTCP